MENRTGALTPPSTSTADFARTTYAIQCAPTGCVQSISRATGRLSRSQDRHVQSTPLANQPSRPIQTTQPIPWLRGQERRGLEWRWPPNRLTPRPRPRAHGLADTFGTTTRNWVMSVANSVPYGERERQRLRLTTTTANCHRARQQDPLHYDAAGHTRKQQLLGSARAMAISCCLRI